jgi:nucleotide-binding universal stress UspA family protein
MIAFRKILFPVDLSEVSPLVVPFVRDAAARYEAEVHIVFVSRDMAGYAGLYVPHVYIHEFQERVAEGGEKKLAEFVSEHFADLSAHSAILQGDPAEEILKYASNEKMDLIIIATHGRKGIDRIIFGSVAEQVVKTSPVPVLVINPRKLEKPAE